MNNLFKKLLAVTMCLVMLFAFAGFGANAANYSNPVFSVNIISDTNTEVQVSLDLVSGQFNCADFKFVSGDNYTLSSIKRGSALVSYDDACDLNSIDSSMYVSNIANGSVSIACSSLYGNQGSFFVATFKKSSSAACDNSDFSVVFTNCSILENGTTILLNPTIEVKNTTLDLGRTEISMNYKDTTGISFASNKGPNDTVRWSSSNESVATVNEEGYVYAAGKGNATITCEIVSPAGIVLVSATCEVTVSYSVVQWIIIILLFGFIWYI